MNSRWGTTVKTVAIGAAIHIRRSRRNAGSTRKTNMLAVIKIICATGAR